MKKLVLAGISLLAVSLLVLGSQTNVVGYQTVQASQQNLIKERINQKELLFQTICDLANNKDIQRVILTSGMNSKGFFTPGMKTPIVNIPVLAKRQLELAYRLGLLLTRSMSQAIISSMIQHHQTLTAGIQQKINMVVEGDARLKGELLQLTNLNCHCQDTAHGPVLTFICAILNIICYILMFISLLFYFLGVGGSLLMFIENIGVDIAIDLNCSWT